jgi:putative FmdB family regulatory protein
MRERYHEQPTASCEAFPMPTYDYRCDDCGEEFEVWQSIKDDPLTACPRCGGPVRKVMSPAGIVLKGSGFYKTDNRRAGRGDGDGKKTDSTSGDTKSDTKPDKKSEKKDTKAASGSKD